MRFDSARAAGLDEGTIDLVADGYQKVLPEPASAALQLTDAIIGSPQSLSDAAKVALRQHFTDAEIVELALGVGLFMGMSKVLICLGLEPEEMQTTVVPTPGGG